MPIQTKRPARVAENASSTPKPSKKDQILTLAASGLGDVADIAMMTHCRPSYVGTVLQEAGMQSGYFDLYTSTAKPMNVYSKFFAGQLGFKDIETATRSVELIDRLYRQFEVAGDRAGQHHALLMALTMFDRARWTDKSEEADVFRLWLADRLAEAAPRGPGPVTDERQDSIRQGIAAPPESQIGRAAAEAKRRRNADSPPIGGGMGGTSDADSPGDEAQFNAAVGDQIAGRRPAARERSSRT